MPSFDIVSQIDAQEVDNAINNVKKEVASRYDFRKIPTEIDFNRKDMVITVVTSGEMNLKAVKDMLISHFTRRKVDSRVMDLGKQEGTSQGQLKQTVTLKDGIEKDMSKKIVKMIKGSKLKVQAAIQDNQVRVTAKKIDDLQTVIETLKNSNLDIPLQFVNMK